MVGGDDEADTEAASEAEAEATANAHAKACATEAGEFLDVEVLVEASDKVKRDAHQTHGARGRPQETRGCAALQRAGGVNWADAETQKAFSLSDLTKVMCADSGQSSSLATGACDNVFAVEVQPTATQAERGLQGGTCTSCPSSGNSEGSEIIQVDDDASSSSVAVESMHLETPQRIDVETPQRIASGSESFSGEVIEVEDTQMLLADVAGQNRQPVPTEVGNVEQQALKRKLTFDLGPGAPRSGGAPDSGSPQDEFTSEFRRRLLFIRQLEARRQAEER